MSDEIGTTNKEEVKKQDNVVGNKKEVPSKPLYPVSTVSTVSNKGIGRYIYNNKGYLGYIGYRIIGFDTPPSRQEIAEKFKISINTVKKTIKDHEDFFEIVDKKGGKELIGLSDKGKTYVENIIKEFEDKNKPSEAEKEKQLNEPLMISVEAFFNDERFEKKYLDEILDTESKYVRLDYKDLFEYSVTLSEMLLNRPEELLTWFETFVREKALLFKDDFDKGITIINLPEHIKKNIGDIRAKDKGKLIVFEGNIVLKSKTEPRETETKFECPSCGTIISIMQDDDKLQEPTHCSCGRKGAFKRISCIDIDEQKLIIEEPYDNVNRDIENIYTVLQGFLTNTEFNKFKNIGDRVSVIGIIDTTHQYIKSKISTKKTSFIKAIGINHSDTTLSDIKIGDKDIEKIKEFSKKENVASRLGEIVFPNIEGHEEVKEAIFLQQAGGVRKVFPDKIVRGDIHILLIGDPGTAKSDLLLLTKKIAPKARYISGQGSSKVGLIGTVRFNEFLGSWTVEGGALVKANNGIVCAEELDKMGEEDRGGLHTAMEQQIVYIDKANVHATLLTQTSLLATANPKHSNWNFDEDILKQFNLPTSLQGRFDLIFPIKDIPHEEKDKKIANKILNPKDINIDFDFVRKYLIYCKRINPKLSQEVKDKISIIYSSLRKINIDKRGLITARDLNALIRLAEANARLRLSEEVNMEDVTKAINLHRFCLEELGVYVEIPGKDKLTE